MESLRRRIMISPLVGALALCACTNAVAQSPAASAAGTELATLIGHVAKQTGKRFILDPRVRGEVLLIAVDPASIDYANFLTVLQVNGFAAVEDGRFVRIVPDAIVRQLPLPIVQKPETLPDAAYMTKVIAVRNVPAAQLVPILRPLLPQQAHLAAEVCTNHLLIVDTAGNVARIEAIVKSLDQGDSYKPASCRPSEGGARN